MTKVNEKQMIIGFVVVCLVVLVLFSYFSYRRYQDIEALKVSNANKEKEIREEEKKQKEIEKFNSEILQLTRDYNQYAEVLPDDKKLEEFLHAIREITDELNIPPTSFKPSYFNTSGKKGGARGGRRGQADQELIGVEVPVNFNATYEQTGMFINKVEGYQRLISISGLSIKCKDSEPPKKPKNKSKDDGDYIIPPEEFILTVSMKLQTYIYNAPVEQDRQPTATAGPGISTIKKVAEWTPDASRDPFRYVVQPKQREQQKAIDDPDNVEPTEEEDDICRYYDLDTRCTSKKNKISDFCQKHFALVDDISKQENTLRKAKELIQKIEDAFDKSDQKSLTKYYGEMDEILRYPFKVEWIKIEIEDIRQRYHKIKEENRQKNYEIILKRALSTKALMLTFFLEGKYLECISEYKKLTTLLTSENGTNTDPEFQSILSEARNLKEKAKIHVEFAELPLEIVGIIWIQKHPEESVAIIDGATKGVDEFVNHGARIVEIRKGEVVFSYKGENIARKLEEEF